MYSSLPFSTRLSCASPSALLFVPMLAGLAVSVLYMYSTCACKCLAVWVLVCILLLLLTTTMSDLHSVSIYAVYMMMCKDIIWHPHCLFSIRNGSATISGTVSQSLLHHIRHSRNYLYATFMYLVTAAPSHLSFMPNGVEYFKQVHDDVVLLLLACQMLIQSSRYWTEWVQKKMRHARWLTKRKNENPLGGPCKSRLNQDHNDMSRVGLLLLIQENHIVQRNHIILET